MVFQPELKKQRKSNAVTLFTRKENGMFQNDYKTFKQTTGTMIPLVYLDQ